MNSSFIDIVASVASARMNLIRDNFSFGPKKVNVTYIKNHAALFAAKKDDFRSNSLLKALMSKIEHYENEKNPSDWSAQAIKRAYDELKKYCSDE